jgi:hypothetical protein
MHPQPPYPHTHSLTPSLPTPPTHTLYRSLLTALLAKAARDRPTLQQVKEHAWFEGFDWDALEKQTLPAPNPPELEEVHIHSRLQRLPQG